MGQWAIAIGINHYQFFQPLSYAQQDAQAIQDFLIQDAGFPPEQCILLTDSSPSVWGKATYPDLTTIQSWLKLLIQQYVQPGDVLWFFFSGYGVSYQGQDYLVPVQGVPRAIQNTAIPIATVFNTLKSAAGVSILVLLDMNRSQGALSPEPIGVETAQLATATGIPTILSCQPEQFSQETAGLNHGLFTAALLESLRAHPRTTLAALGQHLSDRLTDLSNHYWRPYQHPLLLWPAARTQQVLLPFQSNGSDWNAGQPPMRTLPRAASRSSSVESYTSREISSQLPSAPNPYTTTNPNLPLPHNSHQAPSVNGPSGFPLGSTYQSQNNEQRNDTALSSEPLPSPSQHAGNFGSTPERSEDRETPSGVFWRSSYFWGGITIVALLLALGVLWRNWRALNPGRGSSHQNQTPMKVRKFENSLASDPTQPRQSAPNSQFVSSQPNNSQTAHPTISGGALVAQAIETAMVRADHASPFYFAIRKLSALPPEHPEYQAGQQAIQKWSQDIMLIAKRRASQKSFDNAILAARLVPKDQPSIYKEAQQAIDQWCPSVPSQTARNPIQQQWVDTLCQRR